MSKMTRGKNSTFGLGEMGYIPLAKKGKKEILGEFFPLKIPLDINIPLFGGILGVVEKIPPEKFH
jgi:hypothetical protein